MNISVTAELSGTFARFTVRELTTDVLLDQGVTKRGLVTRFGLTDAQAEQCMKLHFNETIAFRDGGRRPSLREIVMAHCKDPWTGVSEGVDQTRRILLAAAREAA